jgi:hypothetical protein|tara:strand:- start:422 stop:562 length:141 start_codon:yes stop_codon:yes gene_type:complete
VLVVEHPGLNSVGRFFSRQWTRFKRKKLSFGQKKGGAFGEGAALRF